MPVSSHRSHAERIAGTPALNDFVQRSIAPSAAGVP